MARVVDLLETVYAARLRRKRHALLGHATINVGSIQGGNQPNIVPDECAILVDRRTLPGESNSQVIREIRQLLGQIKVSAELKPIQTEACIPLETDAQQPLVRALFAAVGQKTPAGVDYFSDAGVLAAGGIPSVLFGPGDIAQAHTPDEWIALDQLERGKDLLLRFFRNLP
jgi:acetylornithine deacetylase/succinyl-diaminopimelate desuccinylase-like protein